MKIGKTLIWECTRIALQSILAHKLRTFLTLLGIIIGVASVMVVGSSIEGLESYVKDKISKEFGSNSFKISKFPWFGNLTEEDWRKMERRNKNLKLEDIDYLRTRCSDCEEIVGRIFGIHNTYYGTAEMYDNRVLGTTANAAYLENVVLADGRFFSEQEAQHARFTGVIGWDLKEKFFPNVDAIGRDIKLGTQPIRVVGVLAKMGSAFGESLDNILYLPIKTYQKIYGIRRSITMIARATSRETFESAIAQARVALRTRHHLKPNEDDDFGIVSADEINSEVDQFTGAIAMVVTPITLISLLVGGIVVMNIMLVSVTERTFEIGIRKAIGARRSDILYQFLIESALLATLGGVLGLALAWGVAWILERTTPIPMTITTGYIFLSIGVSGGIGILFGIYPAHKAAKLDPIVALGTER